MPEYICISLDCRDVMAPSFTTDADPPVCPRCGYTNTLRRIALIHLLVRDRLGTIRGQGSNYRILCGADIKKVKHATGDPTVTNCPACKAAIPQTPEIELEPQDPFLLATNPPTPADNNKKPDVPTGVEP